MTQVQRLTKGADFNAVVYERGKLHVRIERISVDAVLCGRRLTDRWEAAPGLLWNAYPERRCFNCDCLGPGAVLRA